MRGLSGVTAPEWFAKLRADAATRFAGLGYPSSRQEAWRYTRLKPITSAEFTTPEAPAEATVESGLDVALRMVFVNGHYVPALSTSDMLPEGVICTTLAESVVASDDAIQRGLDHTAMLSDAPFGALNSHSFSDGAYLRLPPNLTLEKPIELVFLSVSNGDGEVGSHPRVLIQAGRHAQATVVERYVGRTSSKYFTNAVTEIFLDEGARVDHVRLQLEDDAAYHLGFVGVTQGRDSTFNSYVFSLGGAIARSEIQVAMGEVGASCALAGYYHPRGEQQHDHYTVIDHQAPHGTSSEIYKGIVEDAGEGSFQGRVLIGEGAVKTQTDQLNRNLLIGPAARANTKPQLEIDNDDVKAAHGSTIGQLDPEPLFYCLARGLTPDQAKQLLTEAFAQEIVDTLPTEVLRDEVGALVSRRLEG